MNNRGLELGRLVVLIALLMAIVSACTGADYEAENASQPTSVSQRQQSDPGGGPKVDSIPIAEPLVQLDPFVDRSPEALDGIVFLVKKYDPGLCFGMPGGGTPDSIVSEVVSRNPRLTEFIKARFVVVSDFEIYEKMQQLLMTKLRELPGGNYEYYFQDGKCCEIISYHGSLEMLSGVFVDLILDKSVRNVPC